MLKWLLDPPMFLCLVASMQSTAISNVGKQTRDTHTHSPVGEISEHGYPKQIDINA